MAKTISIDEISDEIMEGLQEYCELTATNVKSAAQKAAATVKREIENNAPKDTGVYAKSWRTKKTKENSNSISVTVYSAKRYMLTHLLEFGHAKRGGGRVAAKAHIAPAEEIGIQQFEKAVEDALKG